LIDKEQLRELEEIKDDGSMHDGEDYDDELEDDR